MVKIWISIDNNSEIILLPVTPPEYEVSEPWTNQQVEGLYQTMNLIQTKGLASINIDSFFPILEYPFSLNNTMIGMEYVNKIKAWRERKLPLRLIVSKDGKTEINLAVVIDDFTYKAGKDGDIYYTLSMSEFTFIKVG